MTPLFMTSCQFSVVIPTAFVVKIELQNINEQRIVIKFYTLLGNSSSEISGRFACCLWRSCLSIGPIQIKDGRETPEDGNYTDWPKR